MYLSMVVSMVGVTDGAVLVVVPIVEVVVWLMCSTIVRMGSDDDYPSGSAFPLPHG